jgi:hypothetical protein
VPDHSIIPGIVNDEQKGCDSNAKESKDPKKQFFFPNSGINDDRTQAVKSMKDNRDDEECINQGIRMKDKSPVRLLLLGHQKERSQKLETEEDNKQKACDSMKNPDKHKIFSFSGNYNLMKLKRDCQGKRNKKMLSGYVKRIFEIRVGHGD